MKYVEHSQTVACSASIFIVCKSATICLLDDQTSIFFVGLCICIYYGRVLFIRVHLDSSLCLYIHLSFGWLTLGVPLGMPKLARALLGLINPALVESENWKQTSEQASKFHQKLTGPRTKFYDTFPCSVLSSVG